MTFTPNPFYRPRTALLTLFALALLPACVTHSLPCLAGSAKRDGADDALPDFLAKATEAVNTKDHQKVIPLLDRFSLNEFQWVTETTTKKWKSGFLTPPLQAATPNPDDTPRLIAFYDWHTCQSDGDHVHTLVRNGNSWLLGKEIKETDLFGLRIRNHTLDFRVDAPTKHVYATDTATFEVIPTERKPYGLFRLSSDFKLTELKLGNANGTPVPFQQVGGIITFQLPQEDKFSLFLKYDGVVDHNGGDYFRADEATINSYFYPHIARQPTTATTTVTAPAGWKPIAIGELVSDKINADKTETATFKNEIPIVFYTVDMGKYKITEREYKGRKIAAYLLSDNAKLPERCLDTLQKSLDYFETNFGKHPYTRYTVVETRGPFEGALEAYSFATFGPFTLPGTIVHELSHTWWGGVVPNNYTRMMWNESFAEYSDTLFQRSEGKEKSPSEASLLQTRRQRNRAFKGWTMLTAHDTSDGEQSSVGYGKGPLVLRVLEDEIGQPAMLRAMQTFYKSYPTGSTAEWSDFERIVNAQTGKDYRWFFSQWLERVGLPSAQLRNVKVEKSGSGYVVTGEIVQTEPAYRLKIPLELKTEKGSHIYTSGIEGGSLREAIRKGAEIMPFSLKTDAKPLSLSVDPHDTIPLALPAGEGNPLVYQFK